MSERPAFIDLDTGSGDEVGDGPVPGWFKLVVVLLLTAAGFYGFSYIEGPDLTSPHTFREGAGVDVPEEQPAGSGH